MNSQFQKHQKAVNKDEQAPFRPFFASMNCVDKTYLQQGAQQVIIYHIKSTRRHMSSKSLSLMERRKQKLGNLQGTIQSLSVVDSKIKARSRRVSIHNLHPSMEMKINVLSEKSNEELIQSELQTGTDIISSEEEGNINTNSNRFEEKYELTVKIGEGAHGVVSKCIHKKDNRVYAAKTIRWEDEHFRFLRTNFINIRQLRHKSIIKYKALFINDKIRVCHTILEYFPHPSLKPGSMTEDTLKTIFLLIVEAVSYLHENSICHRDIKPDNILYDEDKQRMKIIDFGVSKNMKIRGSYETMLTDTGTFYYKAPEMFMGAGYTEAVDVWAIGISLYEMITGSTPFASEYLSDTKDNIFNAEIDFEHPAFQTYSPLVKDLISNLLKKDPKERISCEQAKNNLWFFSNIEEFDIRKSADIYMIEKNIQIKEKRMKGSLKRKVSLKDKKSVDQQPVTENQKKLRKLWLETINQVTHSHHTSDIAMDFVESEEEDSPEQGDDFSFKSAPILMARMKKSGIKETSAANQADQLLEDQSSFGMI